MGVVKRQRDLAFAQIGAEIFADCGGFAHVVENVVGNLKGVSEVQRIIPVTLCSFETQTLFIHNGMFKL